jgi:hypothetical protein
MLTLIAGGGVSGADTGAEIRVQPASRVSNSAVSRRLPFERLHVFKDFGCGGAEAARDGLVGKAVDVFKRQ